MRRLFFLSLLLSLPALAEPSAAEDRVKQTVEAYLGTIDTPIPDARWKALGPDAGPVLASIATEDVLPSRRARALHALSLVDAARAAPIATADAANAKEPLVVRSAAVRAVAKTLPASEAVAVLRPVLTGSSASLQRRTAEAPPWGPRAAPSSRPMRQASTGKHAHPWPRPSSAARGRPVPRVQRGVSAVRLGP